MNSFLAINACSKKSSATPFDHLILILFYAVIYSMSSF